jgi:hypothetical protein
MFNTRPFAHGRILRLWRSTNSTRTTSLHFGGARDGGRTPEETNVGLTLDSSHLDDYAERSPRQDIVKPSFPDKLESP